MSKLLSWMRGSNKKDLPRLRTVEVLDKHLSIMTKSYKIKNTVFTLSLMFGIVFMFWRFVFMQKQDIAKTSDHVAVVKYQGSVSADNHYGSGEKIYQAIEDAYNNPAAKAIVIVANSGGGSPVQAEIVNSTILRVKERRTKEKQEHESLISGSDAQSDLKTILAEFNDKPIITIVEDVCASACYLALVSSDKLVAHPSSLVGSIGVRVDSWQLSKAIERFDVKRVTFTSGKNKAILDPFVDMTEEHNDAVRTHLVDPLYELFVDNVIASRGDKLVQSDDMFSGLVFHGEKARSLGLVDEVSSYDTVLNELYQQYDVRKNIIYNEQKFSLQSVLQSSFDGAISALLEQNLEIR